MVVVQFGVLSSLLLMTISAVVAWIAWKKNRRNQLMDKLPSRKSIPLLGHLIECILNDGLSVLVSLCKECKGIVRGNLFIDDIVLISGPEYLRTFYSSTRNIDKATMYDPIREVLSNSILIADGQSWKETRKMYMSHFFSIPPEVLRDVFSRSSKDFFRELASQADGDFISVLKPLQIVSAQSVYDIAYGGPAPEDVLEFLEVDMPFLMKTCFLRTISPLYYFTPVFRLTPDGRRFKRVLKHLRNISESFVEKLHVNYKEIKRKGEAVPVKFLYSIMEHNPEMTIEDITSELINLIPAAVDTSSQTMGFILNMLALHPEVLEKVLEEDREIQEMLDGREASVEDLQKYVFFELVVKETLRLFPVGPIVGRKLAEDTYFGEYLIPAETNVLAFQNLTYQDETIFPNPRKFIPERFLPENAKNIPPYAYNPFSNGPRNCPGQRYAFLSMKTLVLGIVRQYRIYSIYSSLEEALNNATVELTLKDRNSFMIRLESRQT